MARYPGAVWRPLPETDTQPAIVPTQLILHTAACRCGDSLHDDFNRAGNNLESHFYVQLDGGVEQYVDTERRADANYKANARAISVETQDDGDATQPWTDLQVLAIVGLIAWAIRTHPGIKPEVCPAWDQPGLGYHTLFGAPSQWTPVAKSCPGPARKQQFPGIVRLVQAKPAAPAILDDMTPEQAAEAISRLRAISEELGKLAVVVRDPSTGVGVDMDALMATVVRIESRLAALESGAPAADLDALASAVADKLASRLAG